MCIYKDLQTRTDKLTSINKSSGIDIGVQPKDPKRKTATRWLLPWSQSDIVVLPPGISEWGFVWETSPPIL